MRREEEDSDSDDPNQKYRSVMKQLLQRWKGGKDFVKAQAQMFVVLVIAYLGNNFPKAYPRNDNHNMTMFWLMNVVLLLAGIVTLKHDTNGSARGIQLLSRAQTEEWKGWMQWAFIMVIRFEFVFKLRRQTEPHSCLLSLKVPLLSSLPRVQRDPCLC